MITKEQLKQEVDKLPESVLEEVYALLKQVVLIKKIEARELTIRNFRGKLDQTDIRNAAYE